MGENWVELLTGIEEDNDFESFQKKFEFNAAAGTLRVRVNGRKYVVGHFSTPSLEELRDNTPAPPGGGRRTTLRVEYGDVSAMLANPDNDGATFQVASQFNCLEFVHAGVVPEKGIARYEHDKTQGPACSIACGPATIVRNYFLNVPAHRGIATSRQRSDGGSSSALGQYVPNTHTHGKLKLDRLGQHKDRQINLADALMDEFVSGSNKMKVKNGYVFVESAADLQAISNQIHDRERRLLCESLLKVGVHEHTQVTSTKWGTNILRGESNRVTQVFTAAAPISYNKAPGVKKEDWAPFATLLLRAQFEATLLVAAAVRKARPDFPGSNKVFLTPLGGGVFGNEMVWIKRALEDALYRCRFLGLDVVMVAYSKPLDGHLKDVVQKWKKGGSSGVAHGKRPHETKPSAQQHQQKRQRKV